MPKSHAPRAVSRVFDGLIALPLMAGAFLPEPPRAFQVLVLFAMLGALWRTGSRLARWLMPEWEPLSRTIAAFTFTVGIAVVPATWMGHFGVLRPSVFLVWTAVAYLASRLVPERDQETRPVPAPAAGSPETRTIMIERALLLAALSALAFVGLREIHAMRYVPPLIFDDISYHLSAVATWIRYGDLRMIRFSMGDPSTPFYPILGEMSSWVLIAPFRDSDVAARWTQLLFAGFSFVAVSDIALRLGLTRRDAALAALAYAGIRQVFPALALTAGNDHSASFFTLAALDGSLALARRPRLGPALATGAALGLLLATKYIGVLFTPVILAVLFLAFWIERRRQDEATGHPPARRLAGLAALLFLTMAVTGGYTYLRNWVTAGNPIFPAPVRISGIEIFPGWGGILASERADDPEYQIDVWHFLTREPRLLGFYFPFTLLPAALLAPLLALARRRWREALVFSLPVVFFLQFRFQMHDHRDIRYFLPGIALAAVALAWLLARWGLRAFPLRAAVLIAIVWQMIWALEWKTGKKILTILLILAAGALLERAWRKWRTRGPAFHPRPGAETWRRIAAAGLLAIAAVSLGRVVVTYQRDKFDSTPVPLLLERLAGPKGTRVAYTGLNAPYLFFGSRLQNQVEIVPRGRALAARTYRWRSRLAQPYVIGPYRQWRANLERLGIKYVVVHRSPWEDPERQWMDRRTDDFQRVYGDAEAEIWQVLPGDSATP